MFVYVHVASVYVYLHSMSLCGDYVMSVYVQMIEMHSLCVGIIECVLLL